MSLGGLIDSFEVDTEEIDRMEDEVNRVVPVVSSSEDEEDEEQTEALQRKRDVARMSRLGSLACDPCNQANILPPGSVRSREPRSGYLDEIWYNEGRGGGLKCRLEPGHGIFLNLRSQWLSCHGPYLATICVCTSRLLICMFIKIKFRSAR